MLWIKAAHIIAMVAWFAGLFYLPRLFVYNANSTHETVRSLLNVMQKRLFWAIMTPAGLITLLLGADLLRMYNLYTLPTWLKIKLLLVSFLVVFHMYCGIIVYRFLKQQKTHSSQFFRWFNEIPTLLLIPIVLLVVIKPTF